MLLLTLLACDDAKVEGPFALGFDGAPDCMQAELPGELSSAFTVEVWVRGDPDQSDRDRPLANIDGVFELEESLQGAVRFGVGNAPGVDYGASLMDGVLHHVAGTFADDTVTLFVDGERVAFAQSTLADTAGDVLRLGCNADGNSLSGLLDELRVSSVVRYTETFDRVEAPFETDADTWMLYHLDEGEGDTATDTATGKTAVIDEAEWVPFELGSDQ